MTSKKEFQTIRDNIDNIDKEIQQLLNKRVGQAIDIAKLKKDLQETSFYKPDREAQVLRNVMDRNEGPMPDVEMARIFREIMSATLFCESEISVAALGPVGTYTEQAALKHFGKSAKVELLPSLEDVFRAVQTHQVNYGVVPVENSSEGAVTHTLDLLIETPLKVCGEVELRIRHSLLSRDTNTDNLVRVFGHSQALAQCKSWLSTNMKGVERQSVASNAEGVVKASMESNTAAIASSSAAEHYGLNIIASDIEDTPGNTTRFLLIGEHDAEPSGLDKTSLLATSLNRPGSLVHLLEPFAENGIDMTRIQSRPSRTGLWEYVFFLDIIGHAEDDNVKKVLQQVKERSGVFKILGSYPQAVL